MLRHCANGFGALALSALSQDRGYGALKRGLSMAPQQPHAKRRAKNVIFLYMDGGVSQVDSFDPKPILDKEHGQPFRPKMEATQFDNIGTVFKSHWDFHQYGQSGLPVSDLFPHIATRMDDICVVRSMTAGFSEHNQANFFLHSGFSQQGRPSMGAWVGYGLGSECNNLPGFVVLNGGLIPSGGIDNFGNGFLPASYQGTLFRAGETPLANVQPLEAKPLIQNRKLALLRRLDQGVVERMGQVDQLESAIANYEMAYRMQAAVPELVDLKGETEATKKLYGCDAEYEQTRLYAVQCLLARRMVEKGVRFVSNSPAHVLKERIVGTPIIISKRITATTPRAVDQPIAGLLTDLKARGLLDETLVVFAGEFGRTPFAQGSTRPRSQSLRLHRLAGWRRHQRWHGLRRHRRVRLPHCRESGGDPRSPRHHATSVRHGPQASHLPI